MIRNGDFFVSRIWIHIACLGLILLTLSVSSSAQVPENRYANFEGAQTNPIRLSPDGTRLFAVNTADARLSVFDLANPSSPRLIAEIPVGLEPVSVNARSNDEVWVVNQLSDSISIVSVSARLVTDTIYVNDEPMDVVFAGGKAFVSVSRRNEIRVFDINTHAQVGAPIAVFGSNPRALAVSPDGTKVYAAFVLSGNRTTIIPTNIVGASPPPPTNPNLPPAPQQGLIVSVTDPLWNPSFIKFNMPDNDVVEINAATQTVTRYFSGVGTINLGLAVRPSTGDVFVTNTDARNLVRFEPALRGHVVDNRITRINVASGLVTAFDLNPGVDYNVLPNPSALATALAQPVAIVFEPNGKSLYVAAFGTDRVARIGVNGEVLSRIQIGNAQNSRQKRGPRGLALKPDVSRLYVLNRISNTISVVNTGNESEISEIPVGTFDPTPLVLKEGRGFLYDAKLSGNGTASCASCHIDSEADMLAWDLGDPGGELVTVSNPGPNPPPVPASPGPFQMHPMKGPMVTQSLRGLNGAAPLHWRGDKQNFQAFNEAFDGLLGGSQIPTSDMNAFAGAITTIRYAPNPNQKLDRTMPLTFANGDPYAGFLSFINPPADGPLRTCSGCHSLTGGLGTDLKFREFNGLNEPQVFKSPQLRGLYLKTGFNNAPGANSIRGFGFAHNGSEPSVFSLLSHQQFFGIRATDTVDKNNLEAYMLCFDTGVAPGVGYTRTLTQANANDAGINADWNVLQAQALKGHIDVIAKGFVDGRLMGLIYRPDTADYQTDKTGIGPFTQTQLRDKVIAGGTLSVMGAVPGTGLRLGIDRDFDGIFDGDESSNRERPADFDGDGRSDLSVFRPTNGNWYITNSSTGVFRAEHFGTNGDVLAPGDFDGDDKTDISVWRPSSGYWYILNSSDSSVRSQLFGQTGDVPATGDYDGDGKSDVAVFRPSVGTFYVINSSDGSFNFQQWGTSEDLPAIGDYDGDAKSDFAVFRPSIGTFYILSSLNGTVRGQQFGQNGDRPIAGYFDGDSKTDIAVFRPLTGNWYFLYSSDNSFGGVTWGTGGDIAAPGDYDGDGRWDITVFRPSTGTYYILQSTTNGLRAEQFGANGDVPASSAYVY